MTIPLSNLQYLYSGRRPTRLIQIKLIEIVSCPNTNEQRKLSSVEGLAK